MTELYVTGLSNLRRTIDDTGYAFTSLNLSEKELTSDQLDNLSNYPHLQFLNLATNDITELNATLFANLPHLLAVNVSENKLSQFSLFAAFQSCQHVQVVNISKNELIGLENPENQTNGSITSLNIHSNHFETFTAIQLHQCTGLKSCDVSFNRLTTVQAEGEEIDVNQTLETLNLSNNQLHDLTGLSQRFPSLVELNLSTNELSTLDQVIEELQGLQQLTTLDLSNNTISSLESYRFQIITKCPQLKQLDQLVITVDERLEAQEWQKQHQVTEE